MCARLSFGLRVGALRCVLRLRFLMALQWNIARGKVNILKGKYPSILFDRNDIG